MIKCELVPPQDLTDEDIRWLDRGCRGAYDAASAKDQVRAALTGDAGIYRLTGDVHGVFVLAVSPNRGELEITALGGKGFLHHFDAVHGKICEAARAAGARVVSGYVTSPGLRKLYETRTSAKAVATLFAEELK